MGSLLGLLGFSLSVTLTKIGRARLAQARSLAPVCLGEFCSSCLFRDRVRAPVCRHALRWVLLGLHIAVAYAFHPIGAGQLFTIIW